jgi:hypothetical protein
MFRSISIIFGVLLNSNKAYRETHGLLDILKFVQNMFVDIKEFVCSSAELVHNMRWL